MPCTARALVWRPRVSWPRRSSVLWSTAIALRGAACPSPRGCTAPAARCSAAAPQRGTAMREGPRTGRDGMRNAAPLAEDIGLARYLREIGRTPLLTLDQEVALAQRVAQGEADAAVAMAQANLRLVGSGARPHVDYGPPVEGLLP